MARWPGGGRLVIGGILWWDEGDEEVVRRGGMC